MSEKILITSALLYANGKLHFGHLAGAYLPADVFARFYRLKKKEVLFLSGSDEYGIAITLSSEIEKRTPRQQVDYYHEVNRKLFQKMEVSFDYYGRTTGKFHAPLVAEFFTDLLEAGYITERIDQHLYSEEEGRFLADRYVAGICPKCGFEDARGDECPKCAANYEAKDLKNPRSKLGGSRLVLRETKHWYLHFEKFKEELHEFIRHKNWRANVMNFILPYIEDLHERAISRDLDWGVKIPLPEARGKVLYVWFDAPIGYISIAKEWAESSGNESAWESFWLDPTTKYYQFIGKDNIVFHSLFFPAMIMGQTKPYKQVDELVANEFLNLEKKQFSKSSGWYIDLDEFLEDFSVESLRYTLLANCPETGDSEFTFEDFLQKNNGDLVGKLGNLAHRTLHFIHQFLDQKIPEPKDYDEDANDVLVTMEETLHEIELGYQENRIRKVIVLIMDLCSLGNSYFDKKAPWKMIKDKNQYGALSSFFYVLLTLIKNIAVVMYPILPSSMEDLWKLLGFEQKLEVGLYKDMISDELIPNTPLPKSSPLFTKIDVKLLEKWSQRFVMHQYHQ